MLTGVLRHEPDHAGDVGHADRVASAVGTFHFDGDAAALPIGRGDHEPDFVTNRGGQRLDARLLRHQQEDTRRDRKHGR